MPQLWRVAVELDPSVADRAAHDLGAEALSVSMLQPPRGKYCSMEIMTDKEPQRGDLVARLSVLAAVSGAHVGPVMIEQVPDIDWLARTARAFPPLRIGRLTIHGKHDRGKIIGAGPRLQIDAATAFGTGEHPSTHGSLRMLQRLLRRHKPRRTLDLGCGSGILALGLARLAHRNSVAVDIERESVRMARANAQVNGLRRWIRIGRSDGCRAALVRRGKPYDLIMANIFARPLCRFAPALRRLVKGQGQLILAGLLRSQENMVLAAYRSQRLHLWRRQRLGEWSVLALRRPTRA